MSDGETQVFEMVRCRCGMPIYYSPLSPPPPDGTLCEICRAKIEPMHQRVYQRIAAQTWIKWESVYCSRCNAKWDGMEPHVCADEDVTLKMPRCGRCGNVQFLDSFKDGNTCIKCLLKIRMYG